MEDFTKVFLEPQDFERALSRLEIGVRRGFRLLCFAVTLRNLSRAEFLQAVGEELEGSILFNPLEVAC